MFHVLAMRLWLLALLMAGSAGAAELTDAIEPGNLDEPLLARAIFGETNQVRLSLGLKPFSTEPRLDEAAETQAKIGSIFRPPSHTNPFPLVATPLDRVKFAGLEPRFVAENIATLSIYELPDGATIYTLKSDPTRRDSRTGQPVRTHTYASFARDVVRAWMNSPGHRANIVDPKLRFLGCAARATVSRDDIPMVFAVQVFFTPKRLTSAPPERVRSPRDFVSLH